MKRDKFQEVKDATRAYEEAVSLAISDDGNPCNPRRKTVLDALECIYPLTKLQTCDWCEELRKEMMDNLLTVHPDDRPLVMKETIHGLFDSFEKSYWLTDLTKIEVVETLDVSLYSYGVKIMDCLIPDHFTADDWRISEMNEDIREYLECVGILAEDMMGIMQDIVGEGSFEARDSSTGASLYGDDSDVSLTKEQESSPQAIKPISTNPRQTRRRGRPSTSFGDKMLDDADGRKLQILHDLMKGRKGKGAALLIYAAIEELWIAAEGPTHRETTDEFGYIGVQSSFTPYLDGKCFLTNEINNTKELLKQRIAIKATDKK